MREKEPWPAGCRVHGSGPAAPGDGHGSMSHLNILLAIGAATYSFTNDVPPGKAGQSIYLSGGTGIQIQNSASSAPSYASTFDDTILNSMTVAVWAKGYPGGWNPWVSKYGEGGQGWQLRTDGSGGGGGRYACWTIRGAGGTLVQPPAGATVYGNAEDMATRTVATGNDGQWHAYVGTFSAATGMRNLYIDGILAAQESGNHAYTLSTNSFLCIGARDSGGNAFGNYFTGNIYDVRISNYDWNTNEVKAFSAIPDPTILGQPPQSITAYVGGTRTISATGIKGTAPFSMHWQLDDTNLVDGNVGDTIISGSTSNVLTITYATTNIQGVYHLVVSNSVGRSMPASQVPAKC